VRNATRNEDNIARLEKVLLAANKACRIAREQHDEDGSDLSIRY
jgi:hypothetical protein